MPAKKKKSGKLSKMTEEERLAYEEQKRLAEEEMKKKKEDMLTQFLKVFTINNLYLSDGVISIPYIFREFFVFSVAEIRPHSQWNLGDFFPILKKNTNLKKIFLDGWDFH